MSSFGGSDRYLTLPERTEIEEIIAKWKLAAAGRYEEHFANALMNLVSASNKVLDLANEEDQQRTRPIK